ncbi:MAG: hypothetical protein CO105_15290 [Comamonadaceae bacterium CG_4_9_14_3_um_filter_60_33]|nr:MAG: hypothetical protein COZ09_09025 [Comamonadaceae bacterium CG_4_10_14_3_um_filter_60_42]PJB40777.1 MAG: hypothetical protein CO105_15290 [Comamonadaceae bacterium CG_4_9_14_3_um_filter_60_33]
MNAIQNIKSRVKKHLKAYKKWQSNTFSSFTPADLQAKLSALGLASGDTLMVHSSFDAFDGFQGKPTDVIAVLQSVVGEQGVVMMPTMSFSGTAVDYARSKALFDVARTPSRMGLLTELFRRSPGVVRSVHPTHSVAIWGADASVVAAGHHLAGTPCGVGSPFDALLKRRGKIVLLGTGMGVLTFFHMLEEVLESQLPASPFTAEVFHLQSKTRNGEILETHCRLYDPAVSKRRNLHKMVPYLKKSGVWREGRVGGLTIIVLAAADVDEVVRSMTNQGVYCYD